MIRFALFAAIVPALVATISAVTMDYGDYTNMGFIVFACLLGAIIGVTIFALLVEYVFFPLQDLVKNCYYQVALYAGLPLPDRYEGSGEEEEQQ